MVFGSIIGSVLGSAAQSRADRRAMRAQEASIARAQDLFAQGETAATPYLKQALESIMSARDQALGFTADASFQGYRAAQDAYRQAQGSLSQNLTSRGLYNSSAALAHQRGLSAQYARNVGQVGSQVAGLRSQIAMNAGAGLASGNQALGDLAFRSRAGMAGIQANVQYAAPQGIAESYGALGGAFDSWRAWKNKRSGAAPAAAPAQAGPPVPQGFYNRTNQAGPAVPRGFYDTFLGR